MPSLINVRNKTDPWYYITSQSERRNKQTWPVDKAFFCYVLDQKKKDMNIINIRTVQHNKDKKCEVQIKYTHSKFWYTQYVVDYEITDH